MTFGVPLKIRSALSLPERCGRTASVLDIKEERFSSATCPH